MKHRTGRARAALTCVALLLALAHGCSSPATPERSYYLLRVEGNETLPAATPEQHIGIAHVEIAPYLDRAGIVLGTGGYEVREARYHLWAEPLEDGIRYVVEARLSAKLGYRVGSAASATRWSKRIEIDVRRFHGETDGTVRLVAGVAVRASDGSLLATEQVSATTRQTEDGYPALVDAQIALLDELSDAIVPLLR